MTTTDFDLTIDRETLADMAPAMVDMLREFVSYGTCRQANAYERRALAEKFRRLSGEAMRRFPDLKLNHCGAKTIIAEPSK